jgi:hypothetical protein
MRAAVIKTFGVPVDPKDVDVIDFMYARRRCALAPSQDGGREPAYLAELDETESMIWTVLDRIRKRDGTKISREVADRLIEAIEITMSERPARGNGAAAHV